MKSVILSALLFVLVPALVSVQNASITYIDTVVNEKQIVLADFNGRWSLRDVIYETIKYDDRPDSTIRQRVNEDIKLVEIDNATIYFIGPNGERHILGYVKPAGGQTVEYRRRCCWVDNRYFVIDTLTGDVIQFSQKMIENFPEYNPVEDYDAPYPRGDARARFTVISVNVVRLERRK